MDDVGIDQMASFGYGGTTPPYMPNITAIAEKGVRFRNTWSMPECSNGRASFFTGRYPFRTNIYQAIGGNDLANSQLTPYDITVPKLLKNANYESAMFGKFHLAGPDNNQAGYNTPAQLGWDYFYGWIGGLPGSLDSTAGGIAASGTYACGFVPSSTSRSGACYYSNNTCSQKTQLSSNEDAAGLQCLDSGGIFVPNQSCGTPPAGLNFNVQNAYYVSPLVIIENGQTAQQIPLTDSRARGYRTRIEADAAINWINSKKNSSKPWMATVSFSSAHTPWQQAPKRLTPYSSSQQQDLDLLNCKNNANGRVIQNQMTEAMDTEFGRILVETGLAKRRPDGTLAYDPKASNTVIVIVGDNGTYGEAVKAPFSMTQAKGTAYQTGVWTPLIVAGPMVVDVNREVDHMVNMVDVFQFFGEVASLDAHQLVPRTLDSVGLLPYLTRPAQPSLRTINFTMGGYNIQANGARNAPCVMSMSSCTQVPISKSVCQDNGGVWWGSGYTDSSVIPPSTIGVTNYTSCCQVNQALYVEAENSLSTQITINPQTSTAIRNDRFKLIKNSIQTFSPGGPACPNPVTSFELYQVNQATPIPRLDESSLMIPTPYSGVALQAYNELYGNLQSLLASQPYCPGDGNSDGIVDASDLANWENFYSNAASSNIFSSVYNFASNVAWDGSTVENGTWTGITSTTDKQLIQQNMGRKCPTTYSVK